MEMSSKSTKDGQATSKKALDRFLHGMAAFNRRLATLESIEMSSPGSSAQDETRVLAQAPGPMPGGTIGPVLIRHEGQCARERSTCGWRDRLISHEDASLGPAAWAHAVDIDGAQAHFHKRSTELYYVLEGGGEVLLDGVAHAVGKGSLVHIPPGVVHAAHGKMRVLVVGIPDIAEDDYFAAN
jgi:mannose-6-phosphate isomerase-like protein (cupin superfamily)